MALTLGRRFCGRFLLASRWVCHAVLAGLIGFIALSSEDHSVNRYLRVAPGDAPRLCGVFAPVDVHVLNLSIKPECVRPPLHRIPDRLVYYKVLEKRALSSRPHCNLADMPFGVEPTEIKLACIGKVRDKDIHV